MILIVDDDPEILILHVMNLKKGLEVETTVHPKQATSIIEKKDIKLCILDIGYERDEWI